MYDYFTHLFNFEFVIFFVIEHSNKDVTYANCLHRWKVDA